MRVFLLKFMIKQRDDMETQTSENPTFVTQNEFNRKPIAETSSGCLLRPSTFPRWSSTAAGERAKPNFVQKLIRLMQQQHPDYQPVYIDALFVQTTAESLCWHCLPKSLKPVRLKILASSRLNSAKYYEEVAKAAGFVMKTRCPGSGWSCSKAKYRRFGRRASTDNE